MACLLKLEDLKKRIAEKDKILIAYSGGVDSSLLAKVANDVLGKNALCVVLDSETLPRSELKYAEKLAKALELNYQIITYSVLGDTEFLENTPSRCYTCKKQSIKILKSVALTLGINWIADGVNLSDFEDYRPGIKASDEEGVWHPFMDAQINKDDIREICKKLGLVFWDKPSSACLSSRLPYGEKITEEKLRMIEEGENCLRYLGFRQLRVRCHGEIARIELSNEDMERALNYRDEIAKKFKDIGFRYITLDIEGFRSGSMNEALWIPKP